MTEPGWHARIFKDFELAITPSLEFGAGGKSAASFALDVSDVVGLEIACAPRLPAGFELEVNPEMTFAVPVPADFGLEIQPEMSFTGYEKNYRQFELSVAEFIEMGMSGKAKAQKGFELAVSPSMSMKGDLIAPLAPTVLGITGTGANNGNAINWESAYIATNTAYALVMLVSRAAAMTIFPVLMKSYGDVAVDSSGNIYVITDNNTINRVTPAGVVTTLPFTGLNDPRGIAVDSGGNVYVTNDGANNVLRLTPANVQTTLPFTGINGPRGIAVDSSNNVYVVNYSARTVLRRTTSGTGTQTTVTPSHSSIASNVSPWSIAVDSSGTIYVGYYTSNLIARRTSAGATTILPYTGGHACGIAVDSNGNVYVAAWNGSNIQMITPAGVQSTVPNFNVGNNYSGIAVDSSGAIYSMHWNASPLRSVVSTKIPDIPARIPTLETVPMKSLGSFSAHNMRADLFGLLDTPENVWRPIAVPAAANSAVASQLVIATRFNAPIDFDGPIIPFQAANVAAVTRNWASMSAAVRAFQLFANSQATITASAVPNTTANRYLNNSYTQKAVVFHERGDATFNATTPSNVDWMGLGAPLRLAKAINGRYLYSSIGGQATFTNNTDPANVAWNQFSAGEALVRTQLFTGGIVNWAMRIQAITAGTFPGMVTSQLPVSAGKYVHLDAEIQCAAGGSNTAVGVLIRYFNSAGAWITQDANVQNCPNGKWTPISLTETCPAGTASVDFLICMGLAGTYNINDMFFATNINALTEG